MLDLQRLQLFPRLPRRTPRAALVLLLWAGMLTTGLGCEDPLAALDQVKSAVAEGVKSAALASSEEFADDEAGKARAGGISLGPEHAKRLYYQFVDSRGRVRFVERKSDVPPQWRDRVGFVEMDTPPPLSPAMADKVRQQRYALVADKIGPKARASRTKIVLYSADWCGWCKKAKQHLNAKGVRYEVRDIDMPNNLDELIAKTGQKGIPVLDVGGKVVTGFSGSRYDELIASARG